MLHNVAPTKSSSKGSGFTLIEILMVMAVLGLLVAIAIPQFMSYRSQAVDAEMKSDLRNTAIAIEAYFAKQTVLPASPQGACDWRTASLPPPESTPTPVPDTPSRAVRHKHLPLPAQSSRRGSENVGGPVTEGKDTRQADCGGQQDCDDAQRPIARAGHEFLRSAVLPRSGQNSPAPCRRSGQGPSTSSALRDCPETLGEIPLR